ncbi:hypothetical protein MRX96_008537 [Rhipicephalus microplus]
MRTAFPLGSTGFPPMKAWISAVIQRPTRDTNHRAPSVWASVQRPGAISQDPSTSDKHTDGYSMANIVVTLSCARTEYTCCCCQVDARLCDSSDAPWILHV